MALLTTMKGLPSGYNKDLQEDKQASLRRRRHARRLPGHGSCGRRRADARSRARGARRVGHAARDRRRRLPGAARPAVPPRARSGRRRWSGSSWPRTREFDSLSMKEWRAVSDLFDDDIVSHVTSKASVAAKRTPQSTAPAAVGRALADVQAWLTDRSRAARRSCQWETSSANMARAFALSLP